MKTMKRAGRVPMRDGQQLNRRWLITHGYPLTIIPRLRHGQIRLGGTLFTIYSLTFWHSCLSLHVFPGEPSWYPEEKGVHGYNPQPQLTDYGCESRQVSSFGTPNHILHSVHGLRPPTQ